MITRRRTPVLNWNPASNSEGRGVSLNYRYRRSRRSLSRKAGKANTHLPPRIDGSERCRTRVDESLVVFFKSLESLQRSLRRISNGILWPSFQRPLASMLHIIVTRRSPQPTPRHEHMTVTRSSFLLPRSSATRTDGHRLSLSFLQRECYVGERKVRCSPGAGSMLSPTS